MLAFRNICRYSFCILRCNQFIDSQLADFGFHFRCHFRVIPQKFLGFFPTLSDAYVAVREPGAALLQNFQIHAQVHQTAGPRDPLPVHNIELRLFKGRGYFVLDHFDAGTGTDYIISVFNDFHLAYFHTDGRVEFQRPAAGGGFGIAEHDAHLLANLVDKDGGAFGFGNDACQFAQGLTHETGLQTYMAVTHLPFDFRPGHQRCHRVDDDDINGAAAHQRVTDLQRLLPVVRLGDQQIVNVYA